MNWLNIPISMLRSPAFIGSSPIERATWLNVIAYCIEQENGGRIMNGLKWKNRQWQQTCGVTAREMRNAGKLLTIEGDDVIVFAYPVEKEEEVKARRIQAGAAARKRWDAQLGVASCSPSGNAPRIAPCNAEGEGEEKRTHTAPTARVRNPLFDALARACGSDPAQMTTPAARACGVALAHIKKASPTVAEADFPPRADKYRKLFPTAALTPSALCNQWAKCDPGFNATAYSTPEIPEPADWLARLNAAYPNNAHSSEARAWQHIPKQTQRDIVDALDRAEAAGKAA